MKFEPCALPFMQLGKQMPESNKVLAYDHHDNEMIKIPCEFIERLTNTLCPAA